MRKDEQLNIVPFFIKYPKESFPNKDQKTTVNDSRAKHLLGVIPDLKGKSGEKMFLDNKNKNDGSTFDTSKANKNNTVKKELPIKDNYNDAFFTPTRDIQFTTMIRNLQLKTVLPTMKSITPRLYVQNEAKDSTDSLEFLQGDLKNLLNYPQNIVFISASCINSASFDLPNINEIIANLKLAPKLGVVSSQECKSNSFEFVNNSNELEFSDKFECGNLSMAFFNEKERKEEKNHKEELWVSKKTTENAIKFTKNAKEYLLMHRFDYNTLSYGQWFYFKIKRKKLIYKNNLEIQTDKRKYEHESQKKNNNLFTFKVITMTKSESMFGKGLKVSVWRNGVWNKEGLDISYSKNTLLKKTNPESYYHTLEFSLEIAFEEEIYVAYNEPYSYTRLKELITNIEKSCENKTVGVSLKRKTLTTTILGNEVEMLIFKEKEIQRVAEEKEEIKVLNNKECEERNVLPSERDVKKIIFIMGRAHPVETASSFVLEGIMRSLLTPSGESLLRLFTIIVVPMLNPDGVIVGNSRCNLQGYDLNRAWSNPCKKEMTEVFFLKQEIINRSGLITMLIDVHAHSKKLNVFAYGNEQLHDPFAAREFPFLLSKVSKNDFLYEECSFKKGNEGTARVSLFAELQIPNVFTLENSYCAAAHSAYHYDQHAYENIGKDLIEAIKFYFFLKLEQNNEVTTDKHIEKEIEKVVKKEQKIENLTHYEHKKLEYLSASLKQLKTMPIKEAEVYSSESETEERVQSTSKEQQIIKTYRKVQHIFKRDKLNSFVTRNNRGECKERSKTERKDYDKSPKIEIKELNEMGIKELCRRELKRTKFEAGLNAENNKKEKIEEQKCETERGIAVVQIELEELFENKKGNLCTLVKNEMSVPCLHTKYNELLFRPKKTAANFLRHNKVYATIEPKQRFAEERLKESKTKEYMRKITTWQKQNKSRTVLIKHELTNNYNLSSLLAFNNK